jgi:hypothetical protein
MALIQLGEMIANIKGSIGGTTYSMNRAGLTAKTRCVGKRVNTNKQSVSINNSNGITKLWNDLTPIQKFVWNEFAAANTYTDRFGTTKELTGFQYFKVIQTNALYFEDLTLTEPPIYSIPDALPNYTATLNSSGLVIEFDDTIDTDNVGLHLYASNCIKSMPVKRSGLLRELDIRGLDPNIGLNVTSIWDDYFGLNLIDLQEEGKFNISLSIYAVSLNSFINGTNVNNYASSY